MDPDCPVAAARRPHPDGPIPLGACDGHAQERGHSDLEIWDLNSSPLDMSVGINRFDSGFDMGRHLVGCIFCRNDAMAFGCQQYVTSRGTSVPDDIGIAGWGDLPISSVLPKRLTSCHVPHLRLGQAAAEMMLARLSDEPVPVCRDIGFHLIPGSTVRHG